MSSLKCFRFCRSYFSSKLETMKTSKSTASQQSKQQRLSHKPKPEIRDDMDSRKNREEGYRGTISKKGDRKRKS
jgi:hypothetical protein